MDLKLVLCLLDQENMTGVTLSSFQSKDVRNCQRSYVLGCSLLETSHNATGKFVGNVEKQGARPSIPAKLSANSQDQTPNHVGEPSFKYFLRPPVKLPRGAACSRDTPSLLSPAKIHVCDLIIAVLFSHQVLEASYIKTDN